MQVRVARLGQVVLGIVGVVRVRHPQEVWMPPERRMWRLSGFGASCDLGPGQLFEKA